MSSGPKVVGRLAPSPTGAQHVGNARTYLIAWLSARSQGGRVVLRMEDIDSPRIKPGAAEQALDDLRWLGLDWDDDVLVNAQRLRVYAKKDRECDGLNEFAQKMLTHTDNKRAACAETKAREDV